MRHDPSDRGISWRLSIANAGDEISAITCDSPSLRPRLAESAAGRSEGARKQAMLCTGLAPSILPEPKHAGSASSSSCKKTSCRTERVV
ncbi:DUF29 family protein [Thiocapsa marina]|uniref:DUF29 family protein n=1 Tax=Thiocapsa marina TaxID=244573 RepID=UPI001111EDC1